MIYKQFYKLSENNEKLSSQKKLLILHKIRGFCYNTPYLLYFLEILLPLIFLPLTFIIIDAYPVTILKICLIYLSFFTLASVISFVFSKNEFGYILNLLNTMYPDLMQKIELEYSEKRRSKLKSLPVKLILQFSPLVLVSLIFISLVGYVQASKKTGDIYYNSYLTIISNSFDKVFDSKEEIETTLKNITLLDDSHQYFIIDSNGNQLVSDNSKLEKFFVKYTLEKSDMIIFA